MLPDTRIHGIGGPEMAEHGFISDFPMEKLSVRGLFEVLLHYNEIKGIRNRLQAQLLQERPAAFVGIDAPDFNLDLEIVLKNAGIPTLHFISPSIWAWRRERIKKIARAVTHMLVIFPFEEEIYRNAQIPVTYVGHPLAEMIPMDPDQVSTRNQLGLDQGQRVVTILPGSRLSEISHNASVFVDACGLLARRDPTMRFVAPMAGPVQRAYFEKVVGAKKIKKLGIQVMTGGSHTAIAAADAVMVASGTATLEVALFKKPMVIGYRMNTASWIVMKSMAYQRWVGLPNIMAREFLVPELLQGRATPQGLASAMWAQISNEQNRQRLRRRFVDMHHELMRNTASESAHAVMQVIAHGKRP